jgi:hypothetical protein
MYESSAACGVQRDFEERLGQQLADLDASIRHNFDKLLAQHLGMTAASICHAHIDAQVRLEGGLLDLAGVVRRLEAKLDRLAEAAQHRPSESMPQQECKVSAGGGSQVPVEKSEWGNEESGMMVEIQHRPDTGSVNCCYSGQESGAREASTRSLFDIIDRVCAGELPAAASCSGRKSQATPVLHQMCRGVWPESDPIPAQRRARERRLREIAPKQASLIASHSHVPKNSSAHSDGGTTQEPSEGMNESLKQAKSELSKKILDRGKVLGERKFEMGGIQNSLGDKDGPNKTQILGDLEPEMSLEVYPLLEEVDRAKQTGEVAAVDKKLDSLSESMSRKLERIAYALGIRNLNVMDNSADDAEDRRRLMEKLKSAFDNDRLRRFREAVSERQRFLEYVFGICKPDQRIGKRGSRCFSH